MAIIRVLCPHCKSAAHLENLYDGDGWKVINNIGCDHLFVEQDTYGYTILSHDVTSMLVDDPLDLAKAISENLDLTGRLLINLKQECDFRNMLLEVEIGRLEDIHNNYSTEITLFEIGLKGQ